MQSPLQRLYKTKLVLASLVGVVAGYALMVIGTRIDALYGFGFLKDVDLHDIGIVLMTSGLIVVLFQYLGNEDAEQAAEQRTQRAVKAEAPAFTDSVIDAIANTPDKILSVTAPEVLDRVIENSLAARIHDRELAADAYTDLREQIVRAKERWYDVRVSVVLSPWEHGSQVGEDAMFVATVKWEFRVTPTNPIMRFSCVSDLDEYRDLLQDPSSTEAWYFEPTDSYDATSPEVFELVQFTADGKARPARRTTRQGSQVYTVNLGQGSAVDQKEVTISYTYRTLVQRNGHLLHLDLAQPTKGFTVQLAYGGCGIRHMNVLDYVAGAKQPRISQLPATDPAPSVEVRFDGWVFPKGGVVFGWVLESEMNRE